MRILIFNWQDLKNPNAGGAEVHLQEVFSRIVSMGHEVTLYCSAFPGSPREETINGIRVIREGGRYLFNFRVPWTYMRRFAREGFDLVIDDMNKIPFYTPAYVREPLYIVTHHLFGKSIFLEVPWPLALYVYLTEKLGFTLVRARRIPLIVGSPSTKNELVEKGFAPRDVEIINYCVDHSIHRPLGIPRSATPLVGYFGRIKKYKSIEQLLRAFPQVRKEVPECRLLIVGEGDHRPALEELSRSLGIADHVRFSGFVTEEEKVRLLQEVWFAVNTSSKEGWGLTVIEANACGTAVLASDVPGLRDAIRNGETGLLYPYGDTGELASLMLRLLRDRALRERLETAARAWAVTFDWDIAARRTLELLERRVEKKTIDPAGDYPG